MKYSSFKTYTSTIILAFFAPLSISFQVETELTKEQAISLAEQFIIDNGYTTLPGDTSKMSYELFDEGNKDSILQNRYNALHPKAFCISDGGESWYIGFLSSNVVINKLDSIQRLSNLPGCAVIVLKNGKGIRMAHKPALFSNFNKL